MDPSHESDGWSLTTSVEVFRVPWEAGAGAQVIGLAGAGQWEGGGPEPERLGPRVSL